MIVQKQPIDQMKKLSTFLGYWSIYAYLSSNTMVLWWLLLFWNSEFSNEWNLVFGFSFQ